MMDNILKKIVETKQDEVNKLPDCEFFAQELHNIKNTKGFIASLEKAKGPAIIAEVKKASPSKGVLRENFKPLEIASEYQKGGAHCLSVLTDKDYFQGSLKNLQKISSKFDIPCLRKDFIIDKRQIIESRIAGADAILLIAAILDEFHLKRFYDIAKGLDLDVLIEVHNEEEMEKALATPARLIGINNRNLETFDVSLDTTMNLVKKYQSILKNKLVVSESGIRTKEDVDMLHNSGVKAFLVGESLIKQENLASAVRSLV